MNDERLALPAPGQPLLLPAPAARRGSRRRTVVIAIAIIVLLILAGWFFHHRQAVRAREANEAARDRVPTVITAVARASAPIAELRLPGSVRALTEASLFARSSGYVKARYADIGDTVRRGDVLAEIDSPDLDQQVVAGQAGVSQSKQQLAQARTTVNDAKSRVDLAQVTYDRLVALVKDEAVSQQQVDQARQDLDTARATLAGGNANVGAASDAVRSAEAAAQRLSVLQGYEKLRAPFDGIVTARNVDIGALVGSTGGAGASATTGASTATNGTAATSGGDAQPAAPGSAMELFRIAQADRVRVFVNVPQENAALVAPGRDARVYVEGFEQPFDGRVTRSARSLDPSARTLLAEVQVANDRSLLVPGMYAQVAFTSPRQGTPLLVPGEAVVARATGLHVATIQPLNDDERREVEKRLHGRMKDDDIARIRHIHLQDVRPGRDYGTDIEIVEGLRAGAVIVANPGDEVGEGALVMPQAQPEQGGERPTGNAEQGNQSPSEAAPTKGRK